MRAALLLYHPLLLLFRLYIYRHCLRRSPLNIIKRAWLSRASFSSLLIALICRQGPATLEGDGLSALI